MRLPLSMTIALGVLMAAEAQALYKAPLVDKQFPENTPEWPRGQGIPVCWGPNIDPEGPLPKRIRAAVEDGWGRYASIWFEGWGSCPQPTAGAMPDAHIIFIQHTTASNGSASTYPGRQYSGIGRPRPTLMELFFTTPALTLCEFGAGL